MLIDKGGWQCKISFQKTHVIKTPRKYVEVRKKAYPWLKFHEMKSEEEIDKIAKDCFEDIDKGREIIKKSKIPGRYIGNALFYKNGKVKQQRVVDLGTRFKNLIKKNKMKEAEELLDGFLDFIKILWSYGLHEKPCKIAQNFGITKNGKIILIDLFEVTDNYEWVKKHLKKYSDKDDKSLSWQITKKMIPYYRKVARKTFNEKVLDEYWAKNLK